MPVYLHDGAASGHAAWSEEALMVDAVEAMVISPFFTPRTPRRAHPDADTLAARVRDVGGHVMFDATTHGLRLPGVDNLTSYNTWQLWDGARGDLSTPGLVDEHVGRVFQSQDGLTAPHLTPTVPLDSPIGAEADTGLALAEAGRRADSRAGQSLAGRRGFWLSEDLDDFVGALAQLRAPLWVVTQVHEEGNYPPDTTEAAQLAALCRTVDSLSRRSRVIVAHSDLFGLPAVAAGADTVGTGWHTKQRVCAPSTYQRNDPETIRRQANWYTYQGLAARLHEVDSEVLLNSDRARAERLYPGSVDARKPVVRLHHLTAVRDLVAAVNAHTEKRGRVAALRAIYETAAVELDDLARRYGRSYARQRGDFVDRPLAALQMYAEAEGIWD